MKLTFQDGRFLLSDARFVNKTFIDTDFWKETGSGYATTNLKAAAKVRRYADEKAEKVFDLVFNKFYNAPDWSLPPFLDAHQREGVLWILTRSRSYLAHAPGAGKTLEAIVAAYCSSSPGQQILFIVPPSLTMNWQREIEKWIKGWVTTTIVGSSDKQREVNWGAKFIICPDSMLAKSWVAGALNQRSFHFIAVDEASRFKETSAQRSRALFNGLIQKAKHAVLLDGSPMPNRPMELWGPVFAMNPEAIDCMDKQEFGLKYCGATVNARGNWEFKHSSNEAELKARLQKDFMHVVTEEQLSHPERLRSMVFMNTDVRSKQHKEWEQKNLGKIKLSDISDDAGQGDIAKFRAELGTRKIPWVVSYVRERLENLNEKIIVFAWHRNVCQVLANALEDFGPGLIMGGVDEDRRELAFDDFQEGKSRVIIGNIAAMGRGHNLQRATRIVFAEFSWCDELNRQCEKRASRKGNEAKSIKCDYIVAPDSMDEIVLNAVFNKQKTVRKVIG